MTETYEVKKTAAKTSVEGQSETFRLYGKHGVVPVGVESEAVPVNNNPEPKDGYKLG